MEVTSLMTMNYHKKLINHGKLLNLKNFVVIEKFFVPNEFDKLCQLRHL